MDEAIPREFSQEGFVGVLCVFWNGRFRSGASSQYRGGSSTLYGLHGSYLFSILSLALEHKVGMGNVYKSLHCGLIDIVLA